VTETSQFNYDDQARRQFEDRFDTYNFDSTVMDTGYGTIGGNYAGSLFSRSETAAVKLYDGAGVVRSYQGVYNTLGGNTGNLTTVSEDWGPKGVRLHISLLTEFLLWAKWPHAT